MKEKIKEILLEKLNPEEANIFAQKINDMICDIDCQRIKKDMELETKIQHMQGRCPNCNSKYYICFDEWGYTPYHLHCDICKINIGAPSKRRTELLLYEHHKRNTYIEYYGDEIKILIEEGEEKIDAE